MRLLVSFKICPNLELLREEDFAVTEDMGIDTHFLPNIINCYDEGALGFAHTVRAEDERNVTGFSPEAVAETMAAYLEV